MVESNQSKPANPSLAEVLDRHTAPGQLWRPEGERVRCVACGHRCLLAPGRRGVCKVRFNQDNQLRVPFGYVGALQCDPVEKKPFFHVYPGSDALTFGMLGCDFHCGYCQNWVTSQTLRDPASEAPLRPMTASQLVATGRDQGARLVVSSYNEPLITAEWAVAVFQQAKAEGFCCAFVSNGNGTPEALEFLRPWISALKIDLKCFNEKTYRSLGGSLAHVTETIQQAVHLGLWVELVTLLVPGFNDQETELHELARFIVSVSPDIPWHVTAFHPDYHMTEPRRTLADDLIRAARIGQSEGLRYVYAGNAPGRVGEWENTRCPGCGGMLIERCGYQISDYRITPEGQCPQCRKNIPGLWPKNGSQEVRTGQGMSAFWSRTPRRV